MYNSPFDRDSVPNWHCSGTVGGALYASKYPEHVENFVLDAILPRGIVSLS